MFAVSNIHYGLRHNEIASTLENFITV